VAYYVFNVAGDRAAADAHLRAKLWSVGERHAGALAPGDLALIYVAASGGGFIGRAELATAVHAWSPSEARAAPEGSPRGVELSDVELWDRAVPMTTVVARVDPTGSNPVVQQNARAGFRSGVVRLTAHEYEAALAASREYQRRR
jgi:hypothetical protein